MAKSAGLTSCRDATLMIAAPCGVPIALLTAPTGDENATPSISGLRPIFGMTPSRAIGWVVTASSPGGLRGGLEIRRGLQLRRQRVGALLCERGGAGLNHVIPHPAAHFIQFRHVRILLTRHVEHDAAGRPDNRGADRVIRQIEGRRRDRRLRAQALDHSSARKKARFFDFQTTRRSRFLERLRRLCLGDDRLGQCCRLLVRLLAKDLGLDLLVDVRIGELADDRRLAIGQLDDVIAELGLHEVARSHRA